MMETEKTVDIDYRNILDSINEGLIILDRDLRILYFNRVAEKLTNRRADECIGRHIINEVFPAGRGSIVEAGYHQVLKDGRAHQFESFIDESDNGAWYNFRVEPVDNILAVYFQNTTDRRKTEEALRQSQDLFRRIVETANEGILVEDADDVITFVNRLMAEILGYKTEEMIGHKFTDYFFAEDLPEQLKRLATRRSGLAQNYRTKLKHKDGRYVWCAVSATPLIDGEKYAGSFGMFTDITEMVETTEALQASENRFRSLFDSAADDIFILDFDLNVLEVNDATCRHTGYTREELLKLGPRGLESPNRAKEAPSRIEELKKHGRILFETSYRNREGRELPLELNSRIINYRDQPAILSVARDISERKKAEEALNQSRRAYRNLAENSSDIISRFDREQRCQYINSAIVALTGKEPAFYINKTSREFDFPEDFIAYWGSRLDDVFVSRQPFHGESEFTGVKGKVIFDIRIIPEFDSEGHIATALVTARDVTETRRLQELESRARRLETAGQIAGQVAHDFNNILAPLMAYPEFIRTELPPDNPAVKFVDDIEQAARLMADINQQLLALGRRGHYVQEPLNINLIISEIIYEISVAAPNLTIIPALAEDLGNIKGGRAQLYRVLFNLANNAREAMHDEGTLTFKTENFFIGQKAVNNSRIPAGEYVRVAITDTGCGIPPEHLSRIFDPFYTLKTVDKKRGSGLGLSVVDAVIKDHRGYIDIESTVGKGTTFFLYLPITRDTATPDSEDSIHGGTESILVVDDDPVQREVTKTLLEKLGYKITTAESGEEATRICKSSTFDLLVLDMIMLPGIDGAETFRRIRERHPSQKSILVSGFAESQRVNEALKMGAGGYFRKPLDLKVIAAAVRRELDKKKAE